MKKVKMYAVKAEWLYGDDLEEKRAKQLAALESLGLKETSRNEVFCNAEQVIALIKSGYCGNYLESETIEELGEYGADLDMFRLVVKRIAQQ